MSLSISQDASFENCLQNIEKTIIICQMNRFIFFISFMSMFIQMPITYSDSEFQNNLFRHQHKVRLHDGDTFKMLVTEWLCWWLFMGCWCPTVTWKISRQYLKLVANVKYLKIPHQHRFCLKSSREYLRYEHTTNLVLFCCRTICNSII